MMKFCKHCQAEFDTDSGHWYVIKYKHRNSGLVCRKTHNARTQKVYQDNRASVLEKQKKDRKADPEKTAKIAAKCYQKRKDKQRAFMTPYMREKRRTDINFRLAGNLRGRINRSVNGGVKAGSAIRDLGCSVEDLKKHLEKGFTTGMAWDNHGNAKGQWDIDHIVPLAWFDLTNREQFLSACHYTNLQPMWAPENSRKGARYDF